jgi:UDP-arabinose 4-epimerase
MSPAPVLVTGGGCIGAVACRALAARGFEPITYDNLSRRHADAVRWGPLVIGDLPDLATTVRTAAPSFGIGVR